jgi:hypothetical protein
MAMSFIRYIIISNTLKTMRGRRERRGRREGEREEGLGI